MSRSSGDCTRHATYFAQPALIGTAVHTAFVHGTLTIHEEWPTGERPRVAQAMCLVDEAGGRVTIVHLHGLRDPSGKGDTPARAAQARRLAELVEQSGEEDDLSIVCGDLNLLPDSDTFRVLAEVGLTDLVGTADTRTSRYTKTHEARQLPAHLRYGCSPPFQRTA